MELKETVLMNKIMGFRQMQAEFGTTGGRKSTLLSQDCREKRANVSCLGNKPVDGSADEQV